MGKNSGVNSVSFSLQRRNPPEAQSPIPKKEIPRKQNENGKRWGWGRTRRGRSGGTRSQRVLERMLSRDGIRRGAYRLVLLHHTLRACDIICFENRFELGTINTPKQNSTAFSKPEGGTREARPTDFPPFFQTNSEFLARLRALIFRRGGGSKSEAILTHSICLIQKEFLLLW